MALPGAATGVEPRVVPFDACERVLDEIGRSLALDLSRRSLWVQASGEPLSTLRGLRLAPDAALLEVFSPLPFGLRWIPSHVGLVAVRRPASLGRVFELLDPGGSFDVLYGPTELEASLVARMRSAARSWRPRRRLDGGAYRDLFEGSGDDWFALEMYFDHDPALLGYRHGRTLAGELQRILARAAEGSAAG